MCNHDWIECGDEKMCLLCGQVVKEEEQGIDKFINQIIHGDCLEVMKEIPDNYVDLVVTDPPYKLTGGGRGDGANSKRPKGMLSKNEQNLFEVPKFEDWLPEVYRVLKEGSHCYIFVNFKNLSELMSKTRLLGFKHSNLLVWEKNNCTPSQYYMKNAEYVLLCYKRPAKYINDIGGSKTVHKFNNVIGNKVHPTEKPIDLLEFYIKNSSKEKELVLDPFVGSGTTAIACLNTDRQYIGIELDERYVEIARRRIGGLGDA